MGNLPSQGLLASYWIPQVGVGPHGRMDYVDVPLTDVLNYRLPNGQPQTNVVFLFNATFTPHAPHVNIPDAIVQQMTLQPGQSQTNVQRLQAEGVKVLLTFLGSSDYGWDTISDPADFAHWVKTNVIEAYGLDGIDIDDEKSPADPQSFMNTIGTLRSVLAGSLITKALWNDNPPYFTTPVAQGFPNAGAYLGQLLDFGSAMAYGLDYDQQISNIRSYHDITVNGTNVGMRWEQLAIGVQAGPPDGNWMTPIGEVYRLAQWCVAPASPPILGMMLFTFSQDIQQFTYSPQNSASKMFPNPDDHQWQRTIIAGFLGQPPPD